MSMYIIPCDCTVDCLSWLQPALPCYLSLALVFVPHTRLSGLLFFLDCDSLKYLAPFAAGEMRLVYSNGSLAPHGAAARWDGRALTLCG